MKLLSILFILVFALSTTAQIKNKIYRDEKYPFSVRYPSDWVPVEALVASSRFKISSNEGAGLATFTVTVRTPPELKNVTAAEFANEAIKRPDLINGVVQTALPGAKIISSGKTYLSNQEAIFIKYKGTYRTLDEKNDYTIYQIITVFEGISFTLSCGGVSATFDLLYMDTCKEIASNFAFIPTKIVLPSKSKTVRKQRNK